MKTTICILCRKRRANQQDWKDEAEKKYCLTCWSFKQFCISAQDSMQLVADEKRINKKIVIKLI